MEEEGKGKTTSEVDINEIAFHCPIHGEEVKCGCGFLPEDLRMQLVEKWHLLSPAEQEAVRIVDREITSDDSGMLLWLLAYGDELWQQ